MTAGKGKPPQRAIVALLELLGRRWTLRILWELSKGRSLTFRELQSDSGDLSPTVLNERLRELRDAGFVQRAADGVGYHLTPMGQALCVHLKELSKFSSAWRGGL